MPLRVICPGCRTAYDLPDGLLGGTLLCGTCRQPFAVPAPPPPPDLPPRTGAGKLPLLAGGVLALALMLVIAGGLALVLLLAVRMRRPPARPAPTAESAATGDVPARTAVDTATSPPTGEAPSRPPEAPEFNLPSVRKGVVCVWRLAPALPPASASGFLVSADGLVATDGDVLGATPGTLLLVGVSSAQAPDTLDYFKAEPAYAAPADEGTGFALLKIAARPDHGPFTPVPITPAAPEPGDTAAALGYTEAETGRPVLSVRKVSLGAPVESGGKAHYRIDPPPPPGGPLVNARGEVIGIVLRKPAGDGDGGCALSWGATRYPAAVDAERLARLAPEFGPLEPGRVPVPAVIAPRAANWVVGQGTVQEEKGVLRVENDGGHYWLTSKEALPENFQLTLRCGIEPFIGKQKIQLSQRNSLVALCVRCGTEETDRDVQDRNGMTFRLTPALAQLWEEGQVVARQAKGSPEGLFNLVLTRQGGSFTVAVNGAVLLTYRDDRPLPGRHPFSVGGYLSRLRLGEVRVVNLDGWQFPSAAP